MAIFYTHPRVDINKTAITRQRLVESEPDSLRLFAPFKSSFGPTNEISILHDISDFTQTYGEFNFDQQGQTALNIRNWLLQGGTVYGMRVDDGSGTSAKNSILTENFEAGFDISENVVGDPYKNLFIKIRPGTSDAFKQGSNPTRPVMYEGQDYDQYSTVIMLFTVDTRKSQHKIVAMDHVGFYKMKVAETDNNLNVYSDIDISDLNVAGSWYPELPDNFSFKNGYEYYLYNPVTNESKKITALDNISETIIEFAKTTYDADTKASPLFISQHGFSYGTGIGDVDVYSPIGSTMSFYYMSFYRIGIFSAANETLASDLICYSYDDEKEDYFVNEYDISYDDYSKIFTISTPSGHVYSLGSLWVSRSLVDLTIYECLDSKISLKTDFDYFTNSNANIEYHKIFDNEADDKDFIYTDSFEVKSDCNISSKYPGAGYNRLMLSVIAKTNSSYQVSVYNGSSSNLIERFTVTEPDFARLCEKNNTISKYVYIAIDELGIYLKATGEKITDPTTLQTVIEKINQKFNKDIKINPTFREVFNKLVAETSAKNEMLKLSGGYDTPTSQDDLIRKALTENNQAIHRIKDILRHPIDVMFDAGYSLETKEAIFNAFCSDPTSPNYIRSDIFVFFDSYPLYDPKKSGLGEKTTSVAAYMNSFPDSKNSRNAAFYEFFYKIKNPLTTSQDYVTPTYFLSQLLPFSALRSGNGTHQPIAGLIRGVLSDVLWCSESPLPARKEELFTDRFNYSENTSTQVYFGSQRTREAKSENTALQFINNALTTNIIVKELERLGREYLFEYNDAITLANLRKSLNSYVQDYIVNNTLSYASVNVEKDPTSPETLNIQLNVKFVGTIEVIKIDLTVE